MGVSDGPLGVRVLHLPPRLQPMPQVCQAEHQEKPAAAIRNSKHNWYCGGLLIRSSEESGVSVRVRLVPPIIAKEDTMQTSEKGFILCPVCGKKTKTKVLPGTTVLKRFPLFCPWCHDEMIIDYK